MPSTSRRRRSLSAPRAAPGVWWIAGLVVISGCGGDDPQVVEEDLRTRFDLRPLPATPYPPDNPLVPERVELGRLLFFDPMLSGERDVSCGTCHHPDFDFADGRQLSAGVSGVGLGPGRTLSVSAVTGNPVPLSPRNAPTVLNAAMAGDRDGEPSHLGLLFWDGRAVGLEGQALVPLASRAEMRGDAFPGTDAEAAAVAVDSIVARLRAVPAYVDRFTGAFPDDAVPGQPASEIITANTVARALAAYQRELVTRNSAYDRFVAGDDDALTERQKHGLELFFGQARCFICHRGAMLTNSQYMVTGVPHAGPGKSVIPGDDAGREEHTGRLDDRYRFRVPTLRNVALTAPYMHSGVLPTLRDVVRFYNDGAHPRHDEIATDDIEVILRTPIGLSDDEIDAIVAFLESLTDPGIALDPQLLTVPEGVVQPRGATRSR